VHGGLPIALRQTLIRAHLAGERTDKFLVSAAHRGAERRSLKPELLPHQPRVELPQRHHVVAKHEGVAAGARDPVDARAARPLCANVS
jgi:hypothetical protein